MMKEFFGVTYDSDTGNTLMYKVLAKNRYHVEVRLILDSDWRNSDRDFLLEKGSVLGIMSRQYGFVRYNQGSQEKRPDNVNTSLWGDKTPPLVGLFLNEHEAEDCFGKPDLKHWDKRFLKNSMQVIKLIINEETFTRCIKVDHGLKKACIQGILSEYIEVLGQNQ